MIDSHGNIRAYSDIPRFYSQSVTPQNKTITSETISKTMSKLLLDKLPNFKDMQTNKSKLWWFDMFGRLCERETGAKR